MLYCNNKSTINIVYNLVHHDQTKHMHIDRHFIKEKLENEEICIPYIEANNQLTDILTKRLSSSKFQSIVGKPDMENIFDLA